MEEFRYYSKQHAPIRELKPGEELGVDRRYLRQPGAEDSALYYWLFPNTMFNIYQDNMSSNVILPLGPDRTLTIFEWFFADPGTGPGWESMQQTIAFTDEIQQEDIVICEQVQRGLRSRAYDRAASRRSARTASTTSRTWSASSWGSRFGFARSVICAPGARLAARRARFSHMRTACADAGLHRPIAPFAHAVRQEVSICQERARVGCPVRTPAHLAARRPQQPVGGEPGVVATPLPIGPSSRIAPTASDGRRSRASPSATRSRSAQATRRARQATPRTLPGSGRAAP